MKNLIAYFSTLLGILCPLVVAEVVPVWSVDVAVPGEKVALYLVDTEVGEDLFSIPKRPAVDNASLELMQHYAGANPMDANRAPMEIYPLLITPDAPGKVQLKSLQVKYNSGRTVEVTVPPLPVMSQSEIKWMKSPVTYGVLWYTDINDGYVHQPVKTAIKLLLPGGIDTVGAPQLNSVDVRVGNFQNTLQGVLAMVHNQAMGTTTAYAKGQNWRTVDFSGTLTPFREGNSDVAGKIILEQRQGFFTVMRDEAELPVYTIGALPLPPGAPANFANMVGEYSISATTTAKSLAMHEAVEVEITVKGTGNLEQLECPKPENAADWKLVPATRKPIVGPNGETLGMVFSQLLRPSAEVGGIPSFSFSYFDPKRMEYRQCATAPIPLEWRETNEAGSGIQHAAAAEPPPAGTVPVAEMTDIYGYMPRAMYGSSFDLPRWLWYLLYLPAVLIMAALATNAMRRKVAAGAAGRARERALSALAARADALSFLKGVGAYIETHVDAENMTPELQQILDRRDAEAFRPDAQASITQQERNIIMRTLRSIGTKAVMLLLCLAPLTLAGSAPDGMTARQDYQGGQYSKALTQLENAQNYPEALRQYNMGNCYYRLNKPGMAALCYARALSGDPGMKEAAANLAFIQRKEGALLPTGSVTDDIFTLLTPGQLWMSTVVSTAALALCIALLIVRRGERKPWLQTCTAVAAMASLLCAADWGYYTTRQTPDIMTLPPDDVAYVLQATELRTTAEARGAGIMKLPPSTPVHLLASRGSWCYVETFTGVRGWLNAADTATLSPDMTPQPQPVIIRFR
ncbi:MAG: BatD family protein [Akkermansia sp.]|nr:BatD family protein [Akkermansia sp.]